MFECPSSFPAVPSGSPIKTRMHCTRHQFVDLCKLLRSSGRLLVYDARLSDRWKRVSAHSVPKDRDNDRLILDARPANQWEESCQRWVRHLGCVSHLQDYFLDEGNVLQAFASDVRDFYGGAPFVCVPRETKEGVTAENFTLPPLSTGTEARAGGWLSRPCYRDLPSHGFVAKSARR